jgi:hypothetical protein
VRKPKRHKSSRNSNARGMPKSLEKVTSKIKWVCLSKTIKKKKQQIKEERQKKIWMTLRVKLLIVILSLWNLETLFEPYESFSFITKNHSLRYMPVEVLSNQASKQPRTINNALKMQRILFRKIHDIKSKLLIIIHADKNECLKRDKYYSYKTSSFFLSPSLWNKRSCHDAFSSKTSLPNTRANNLFSKKENNQGVARFQKQIVLDSHRNNFCFQNARSRFQDSF